MQFSAAQDVRLKNYGTRSSFCQWSEHGLLEGSIFLFQCTSLTSTLLESSRLGELKHAISAGYDIRLKNESLNLKGQKNYLLRQAYMVTVVWAARGIDIIISIQLLRP